MKTILKGWNFMRLLRLCLGIAIAIQGILLNETLLVVLGLVFTGLALANVGCCGPTGCAVKQGSQKIKKETTE